MLSPPNSPKQSSNTMTNLIQTLFSDDSNVLLAAVISLLLVILFVLLLHVYAKWFLAQARQRSRGSVSASHVLDPARFRHLNTLTFDTARSSSVSEGLEASVIALIPLFLYDSDDHKHGLECLECVICLSAFEEQDVGRKLPKCGHVFHVECIDMWLHSHSSCPICRAPLVTACETKVAEINSVSNDVLTDELSVGASLGLMNEESALEIVVEVSNSDENENGIVEMSDSLAACSSSSSSSSLSSQVASLGGSLKRMLSRNRSERKILPSANVNESDT